LPSAVACSGSASPTPPAIRTGSFDSTTLTGTTVGTAIEKHTERTLTDWPALLAHLREVAERGYAIDNGEHLLDVRGVAAPVRDYTRNVVGAFGIGGPAYRMSLERIDAELAPLVQQAAKDLSARLGFHE
jgi:IclR family transcriptional regulator, KDG regulon repressor